MKPVLNREQYKNVRTIVRQFFMNPDGTLSTNKLETLKWDIK